MQQQGRAASNISGTITMFRATLGIGGEWGEIKRMMGKRGKHKEWRERVTRKKPFLNQIEWGTASYKGAGSPIIIIIKKNN